MQNIGSCLNQVEAVEAGQDPLNQTEVNFINGEIVSCHSGKIWFQLENVQSGRIDSGDILTICLCWQLKHQVGVDSVKVLGWTGGPVSCLIKRENNAC